MRILPRPARPPAVPPERGRGPRLRLPWPASARARVIAGFAVVAGLLIGVVGVAAVLSRDYEAHLDSVQAEAEVNDLVLEGGSHGALAALLLQSYILSGDERLVPEIRDSKQKATDSFRAAAEKEAGRGSAAEAAALLHVEERSALLSKAADEAIALRRHEDAAAAMRMLNQIGPSVRQLRLQVSRLSREQLEEIAAQRAESDRHRDAAFLLLVLLAAAAGAAALAISVLSAASILRPLSKLEAAALAVAGGDLGARAPVRGPRELARVGAALNQMTEALLDASRRRELEAERERLSAIVEATSDFVGVTDPQGRPLYLNAAGRRMLGIPAEGIGPECTIFDYYPQWAKRTALGEAIPAALRDGMWSGETALLSRDGREIPVSQVIVAHKGPEGATEFLSTIARDVTERRRAEEAARRLAFEDPLTSLPNRALLQDRFAQALMRARLRRERLCVMYLGLDRVQVVNDTLGHAAGDRLLREAAGRLRRLMRPSDTVARANGDEFVMLLDGGVESETAAPLAERVLDAFRRPFAVDGREFHITASIGISFYPNHGDNAETLLRNADAAMCRAKRQGRNHYQVYTPCMNAGAMERLAMEAALRQALRRQEFTLHYQPQVSVRTGEMVAAEALLRWRRPDGTLAPPGDFIPIAEESGVIVPLGEWVLRTACAQAKAWHDAGSRLRTTVNISMRQIQWPHLADIVSQTLRETGLDARYLELEITESAALQDEPYTISVVRELAEMGVRMTIDDFGTGYSSLRYLKEFPVQAIKIDRSYVNNLDDAGSREQAIASYMILLGHTLNLDVVAEGVETGGELERLRERDCDLFQGYLYSRPVPPSELTALLARRGGASEAAGTHGPRPAGGRREAGGRTRP